MDLTQLPKIESPETWACFDWPQTIHLWVIGYNGRIYDDAGPLPPKKILKN